VRLSFEAARTGARGESPFWPVKARKGCRSADNQICDAATVRPPVYGPQWIVRRTWHVS
jgi:hypothetical protein